MRRALVVVSLLLLSTGALGVQITFPPPSQIERIAAPAPDIPGAPTGTAGRPEARERGAPAAGLRNWFDRWGGSYRMSVYREEHDDAAAALGSPRAFRPEETYIEGNLRFDAEKEFDFGWLWDLRLAARHTEDPSVNPATTRLKLLDLRTRLRNPDVWELGFGNLMGQFSRYVFTRSFEGMEGVVHRKGVSYLAGGDLDIVAQYGRTARAIEGATSATPLRLAWGYGIDWKRDDVWFLDRLRLRLAGSGIDDVRGSIDDPRGRNLDENDVFGFAADLDFGSGWTLGHEMAHSTLRSGPDERTRPMTGGWSYFFDLRRERPRDWAFPWDEEGFALWFLGRLASPVRTRYYFETADRDFATYLGSGAPDQRRLSSASDFDFEALGRVRYRSEWTRDDIEHFRRTYNRNYNWSVDWRVKPLGTTEIRTLSLRDIETLLAYRMTTRWVSDRKTDMDIEDYRLRVDWPLHSWRLGFDLGQQISVDHARGRSATGMRDERSHTVGLSIERPFLLPSFLSIPLPWGYGWDLADWRLTPSVRLEQGRRETFRENFRTSRTQRYDFAMGVEPTTGVWNSKIRFGLWDLDDQTLASHTEDLQTDLNWTVSARIPYIEGSRWTFTWDRKTYDADGAARDLDSNLLRFDLDVPF